MYVDQCMGWGRLNLFPLSITHTRKEMDSHRYHISFIWRSNKWTKVASPSPNPNPPQMSQKSCNQSERSNIPENLKVLTFVFKENHKICITRISLLWDRQSLSLLVKTWSSGNWKVIGSEVECAQPSDIIGPEIDIKFHFLRKYLCSSNIGHFLNRW